MSDIQFWHDLGGVIGTAVTLFILFYTCGGRDAWRDER